jgi:ABC-2 type transport system permease protein
MLFKVLGFEVRYQLRSPLFAIGFAIFLLIGFAFAAWQGLRIEGSGNVLINGPYGVLLRVAAINTLGVFVFTAFMANVVIRDDETGLAPIIRSTRITKRDYLLGRFLGAYLVALLVMMSVPLGTLLGTFMPWLDPERIGPTVLSYYLYGFGVFVAPTVLAQGAIFFALATATRSMMWTYVGVVASLVLFVIATTLLNDPEHLNALALSDPFGEGALEVITRYWTAADRDTQLPGLAGILLYNRLLWLAVGLAALAVAYAIFRFDAKAVRPSASPLRLKTKRVRWPAHHSSVRDPPRRRTAERSCGR